MALMQETVRATGVRVAVNPQPLAMRDRESFLSRMPMLQWPLAIIAGAGFAVYLTGLAVLSPGGSRHG